jgi:enoyl-CoA hydratase
MAYDHLLYSISDNIAHITLNRPEKRNALNPALRNELVAALKAAESDDSVALVLLSGAGEAFCAGYDIGHYDAADGEGRERPAGWVEGTTFGTWSGQFPRSCYRDWMVVWDLLKPVVAKIHGYCLAGGSELMSMCDIVFAADDTIIGYPPSRAQATPDLPYFPWKMPMAQAKYLQLTGNTVTGREAASLGWVVKSFPRDELDESVMRELRPMSKIHPAMLSANKGALNQAYEVMGMKVHLQNSWQWHALSRSFRPGAGEFHRIAEKEGLRAAIAWRDGNFRAEGFAL